MLAYLMLLLVIAHAGKNVALNGLAIDSMTYEMYPTGGSYISEHKITFKTTILLANDPDTDYPDGNLSLSLLRRSLSAVPIRPRIWQPQLY